MNKELLIDAIIGCGFKSIQLAVEMTNKDLARFSGNQWNENWSWKRDKLKELSLNKLRELYTTVNGH